MTSPFDAVEVESVTLEGLPGLTAAVVRRGDRSARIRVAGIPDAAAEFAAGRLVVEVIRPVRRRLSVPVTVRVGDAPPAAPIAETSRAPAE